MDIEKLKQELKKHEKDLSRERDKLRDFLSRIVDLDESCTYATESLREAIDSLSELV